MTSDKRDLSDFYSFPGYIKNNMYTFPTLKYDDKYGHTRSWKIFIRLVKDSSRQTTIDWNMLEETEILMEDKYFGSGSTLTSIPEGTVAQLWTETGIDNMKITRSIPTYYAGHVLVGQINERNELHQALITARSEYLKIKNKSTIISNDQMISPMLAHIYRSKDVDWPAYVQPKLDGVRCLCYLSVSPDLITADDDYLKYVVMYTRQKKIYPSCDYLKQFLYTYLCDLYDRENNQSIYLDGEFYNHGTALQDISGSSRNSKSKEPLNQYHIYDCFYPQDETDFEDRHIQLEELFLSMEENKDKINFTYKSDNKDHTLHMKISEWICKVPTTEVENIKQTEALFKKYTDLEYEGIIIRNIAGLYTHGQRSYDLLKMKSKFTDEFKIVGYKQGSRGKDKGALIWIAQTDNGIEFSVTPKMTYEERYKAFTDCENNFIKKYNGVLLTVEHEGFSTKGVPLRAHSIGIRQE